MARRRRYGGPWSGLFVPAVWLAVLAPGSDSRGAPHRELGEPWIESWGPGDYPANSHQNWDLELAPDGQVWAASSSGVQYFDGVRWRLQQTPHSTIVYSLEGSEAGRWYLGTTSDIGYLEPGPGARWRYVSLLGDRQGVPEFGDVLNVEVTPGSVYFQARTVLFRFQPESGDLDWLLPGNSFQSMAAVGEEVFLADREEAIVRYDPVGQRLIPYVPWAEIGEADAVWLFADRKDRLLLLIDRGLFAVGEGKLRRIPTEADEWLRRQQPYRPVTLADGTLAIGSRLDGLVLLDADGNLKRHLSGPQGLPWTWVCNALLDRQGGLWITQDGGISHVEADPVLSFFGESSGIHSVQALARYRGRLIAATTIGLKTLEPADSAFGQARFVPLAADDEQTWSLLSSEEDLLYGDGQGVSVLRFGADGRATTERVHDGRRAVRLTAARGKGPGVTGERVYGATAEGVVRLRRTREGWRSEGLVRGIEVPTVFVEQEDQGALWAGTITGTYFRITSLESWPEAAVETFSAGQGVPRGNAHLFRGGGEILFGTYDGFFRFSGRGFEPDLRFPAELRDGSRDIHRLAEAADGTLWIYAGGSAGPATRRPDGSFFWDRRPLSKAAGEKVSALHIDDDGVVWLGRRSGVVRFDPARWRPPAPMPPARVVSASVPGEAEPFYGGAVAAETFQGPPLPPSQDALRLHFGIADFAAPRALEFRSRLDGVDSRWSEWTAEDRRDFTSLPPGQHTLRVEARNVLGQVSPQGSFRFRLLAPWYRSWPAYAVYGLAALLLVAGSAAAIARRRTARLERERLRLQALVEERTREIRRQADELAAQQQVKDRFFSNVSHELRTPLTLTLGPLEDAATGRLGPLSDLLGETVESALRNARQLRNLVDQVLDVGRLEAGRMPLAAAPGDLGAFVRRVGSRFAAAAERSGITLDLEAIETGVEVYFDRALMERVVGNLLSNALKFTPAGGTVAVRASLGGGEARVEVRDSGVGIAAEDLPRVFDRYFQAGRTVAEQPGTGIGLALVRELVELHGGRVEAESSPGAGSRFRLRLPLGREHLRDDQLAAPRPDEESPATEPPPRPSPASPPAAGDEPVEADATTLLIVEDNAELRGFLRQRFAGRYRVLEAADGSEGLGVCRRITPDLVISDVMMPGMDGLELTRRLREDPDLDFIPIILLTARAGTEDAVEGLGAGADDYLRKPFDGAELEARVERLIASRRHLRARFAAPEPVDGLAGADAEFDRRLLAAIEEQLGTDDLSVQSLADTLAMDRSHLYRRVQAVRGTSPQALILKIRLQAAARMLARGEGTVSEVAYSVGFNSLSHFSDSFRRHFGLAPSKWRRQAATAPA